MFGSILSTVLYRVGPWPNQAHVALQDVPKLGQFVETVLTKKPAKARDPRIIGDLKEWTAALIQPAQVFLPSVRPGNHCPKLVTIERAEVFAQAQRAINHRAARLQLDGNADR